MRLSTFIISIAFGLVLTLGPAQNSSAAADASSLQLIQLAYDRGELSNQERVFYSVQSIKEPESLPEQFRSENVESGRCATTVLVEAYQEWSNFESEAQTKLSSMLVRPSQAFSIVSPDGYFRIHYDLTGPDAVPSADVGPANGIPDFVEWLADYADSSYRTEVDGLNQLAPPSDNGLGGDNLYDIYTEEMVYYGYAQPEGAGPEPWNDSYSYIAVHRDFEGFPPNTDPDGNVKGAAKVTLAHELYHAIQFAYDVGEHVWFMETSSTWMEDYVYDVVNDNYNYLPTIFDNPEWPLHSTTNGHLYSAFVWGKYLEENFGAETMPDIWNELISTTPYPAFTTVLAGKGATVPQEVAQFRTWMYITSSRDDGNHFEEAENYLVVDVARTHSTYPVTGQGPPVGELVDGMGASFVVFDIPPDAFSLTVEFDGQDDVSWIVNLLARDLFTNEYAEFQMPLDAFQAGEFTLTPAVDFQELTMVMVNVSQGLDNRSYVYGADYDSSPSYAINVNSVADDSVYSNKTVTVSFNIENLGLQADNFNVTVSDQLGWPIAPSSSSLFLTSGEVAQFSVQLTAPASELIGAVNSVSLLAEASSVAGVFDTDSSSVEVFLQHGDCDQSGDISISDGVYIVNYVFGGGNAPIPEELAGDADCNGGVSISDAVAIINYIFGGGPYPPCNAIQ